MSENFGTFQIFSVTKPSLPVGTGSSNFSQPLRPCGNSTRPVQQRLWGDGLHSNPQGWVLPTVFLHQAYSTLMYLRGKTDSISCSWLNSLDLLSFLNYRDDPHPLHPARLQPG
jgi:hypothetical protein